jgi:protease I
VIRYVGEEKIVMLAGPGFEDPEFWVVYMRMVEAGFEVRITGVEKGKEYTSKSGGLTAGTEFTVAEIPPEETDAVLIPGGWAPDKLRRDRGVLELVRGVYERGAVWVDEPAFSEGNLVWGRVVKDIPFYCRELINTLQNK